MTGLFPAAWRRSFETQGYAPEPNHSRSPLFTLYSSMPQLILVVDDEPKVTRLARDYLEKNGFRVATAADGQSR